AVPDDLRQQRQRDDLGAGDAVQIGGFQPDQADTGGTEDPGHRLRGDGRRHERHGSAPAVGAPRPGRGLASARGHRSRPHNDRSAVPGGQIKAGANGSPRLPNGLDCRPLSGFGDGAASNSWSFSSV
ncbi:MAG: hypothetical protein AVDCRST_MAG73-2713, partial [uncultured Thermomicrobiales bacterium]